MSSQHGEEHRHIVLSKAEESRVTNHEILHVQFCTKYSKSIHDTQTLLRAVQEFFQGLDLALGLVSARVPMDHLLSTGAIIAVSLGVGTFGGSRGLCRGCGRVRDRPKKRCLPFFDRHLVLLEGSYVLCL